MLKIINGQIYDPANGLRGEIRDICIADGKIVDSSAIAEKQNTQVEVIDAAGCIVMPGGVDIHAHVAGPKVNSGRIMCPEDHYDHFRSKTAVARAGSGYTVPTTFMTGYNYALLGYTTVFEAAVPPLEARHTHEELQDVPLLDNGCYTLMGNNYMIMKVLSDTDAIRRRERMRQLVAWLLRSTRGYAVKIVNPGGVENWKWNKGSVNLDTPTQPFGVTPRQIILGLAEAADELGLPHPIHLHANHLGEPGNYVTTLETMRALDGYRTHFTHLQFHSYGRAASGGFTSEAAQIAEYLNNHPEFTCDVGQLVFGPATTMTADSPMQFRLHQLTGHKWGSSDVEMEGGSGIVPMIYKPSVLANAIQWAVGLELLLLVKNPWQIFLTTDHPNAGPFTAYPEIIHLLMDAEYRRSCFKELHARTEQATCVKDIDREYTLEEIAIITRAGTARALGLQNKGHLGVEADADIAIYPRQNNIREMFTRPNYVIKEGKVVARNGEILASFSGKTLVVNPAGEQKLPADLAEIFKAYYSVTPANFAVEEEYVLRPEVVSCR
ncbi:formylmethanofuran dehydrogenase subunit A [Sporomusa sphaeroides]|uniref:formylmethanofuran dehydrogenase subunit A n=1 Tax=Sporomusa sphaeroides TaxID=47679 RepID=UPI00202EDBA0|nr:formylmethanofuran dehydrogenase subunit A [Sporomusa sphaeroides]MCM0759196.1 formylmethanofuran dehydrogenase subunit A [Sporomusa sphaeroides DSM 2875]HML35278.1 formylmethanofuran dehydrogenase subunit A [Sporomusa sphaeroides]